MVKKNIILSFLQKLVDHNDRVWFDANKLLYLEAKESMESLVNQVIQEVSEFDSSIADQQAKKCLFRIYRDIRFSKNKLPYKTNMGAVIVAGGRKTGRAGYYIHIEPGASFLAGGMYLPESKILKSVREEVMYGIDEFNEIINDSEFKSTFGAIYGDRLKRPPKGFPADFKEIELLKLKSFALFHPMSDEQVMQEDFIKRAKEVFRIMMPFNHFLNRSFDG